jgi:hypothetical protein
MTGLAGQKVDTTANNGRDLATGSGKGVDSHTNMCCHLKRETKSEVPYGHMKSVLYLPGFDNHANMYSH